ncbi:hypothetical protein KGF54_001174 [Candida jiufengensis]|uniref:uncharacterized protein n=1 Tax=Candida jiufengensis TaxID=497108 RepID=UPI002224C5E9|nr:uncharacterized protein KGF54_001174 [Candida jiufengensis]KAI5955672.1 hypothetical protein KGF54_001174 [Candida jiufengensis]
MEQHQSQNQNIPTNDQSNSSHSPTQSTDPDSDPLELHQLSLSYDYLIYKIKDYIKTLTDQTYTSIVQKQNSINNDYFEKLKLSKQYDNIDNLLKKCNDLELEFMKIDQLVIFVEEFKQRLDIIESRFKELD